MDEWKAGPRVVYVGDPFPETVTKSVFLAGPSPRGHGAGWRRAALDLLNQLGFDGTVFVPQTKDWSWLGADQWERQIEWEEQGLNQADSILFWVPRDVAGGKLWDFPMAGLTTNDEWGVWKNSGKVVWGAPGGAEHVRYQEYYAKKLGVWGHPDLPGALKLVIEQIGDGALRQGGETQIPLHIWKRPEFQEWYTAQKAAGNRLDGARVSWTFRVPPVAPFIDKGPPKGIFAYGIHANIHIGSEKRNKTNEAVIFRPNTSAVILWEPEEQVVVLVKEFRTAARNRDCMVYELPGGSSPKPNEDPLIVAAHEVEEETGLKIGPSRLENFDWGTRQLVSTLSAHTTTLFSCQITRQEVAWLRANPGPHGVEADSERTYVEVWHFDEIFQHCLLDWSTLGMIQALLLRIRYTG